MTGDAHLPRAIALPRTLASLTDRQRLDFARWLQDQRQVQVRIVPDWGIDYQALKAAEDEAAAAFDELAHDGTVSDADGSAFFDPSSGVGLSVWSAAIRTIRMMAGASQVYDREALEAFGPAFDWLIAAGGEEATPAN
jgi:hypothetical protein